MVSPKTLLLTSALALSACGDFEAKSIVLDLRVLGMQNEPPEIVSPVNPDRPTDLELRRVSVCSLIADPGADRQLDFTMRACAPTDDHRCDQLGTTVVTIGSGTLEDPERAQRPVQACGELPDNADILAILREAIDGDSLSGFGGVEVQVELAVSPAGDPTGAQFAFKRMLYSPRIPEERVANTNPRLDGVEVSVNGAAPIPIPLGRCGLVSALEVRLDDELTLTPIEPDGVREDYVVPAFDGSTRSFTENMTYAWFATHGDWSRESTGGPRDFAGNQPPLDTTWTASIESDVLGDGRDVSMWIVQRDERGGQQWYLSCVRVLP